MTPEIELNVNCDGIDTREVSDYIGSAGGYLLHRVAPHQQDKLVSTWMIFPLQMPDLLSK